MRTPTPSRTRTIRLHDDIYDKLLALAIAAGISPNKLVAIALRSSFDRPNFLEIVDAEKLVSRSQKMIAI